MAATGTTGGCRRDGAGRQLLNGALPATAAVAAGVRVVGRCGSARCGGGARARRRLADGWPRAATDPSRPYPPLSVIGGGLCVGNGGGGRRQGGRLPQAWPPLPTRRPVAAATGRWEQWRWRRRRPRWPCRPRSSLPPPPLRVSRAPQVRQVTLGWTTAADASWDRTLAAAAAFTRHHPAHRPRHGFCR